MKVIERRQPTSVVPAYPTARSFARLGVARSNWREWFPFNAPGGRWTFSGRVALYHGLPSLDLPANSTILVPAYHQGVEIETLLAAGYRVRYYRVDEQLSVDLRDVEQRLDGTVSALYVIHYFGFAQPLEPIRRFCHAHRLRLIEDCALSLFSHANGTWLGSVGDLALFSVYKTLPVPHGGFLVTRPPQAAEPLRPAPLAATVAQTLDLVHCGLTASEWLRAERLMARATRLVTRTVRWSRSETISAGGASWDPRLLGHGASAWTVWLMRFMDRDLVVSRRRANFVYLASRLRGHISFPFPELPAGVCPLFFPIMVADKLRFQRDLDQLGVQTVNLWETTHRTCPPDLSGEVDRWRRYCLEIPIHQELTIEDMDRLADAVLAVSRP